MQTVQTVQTVPAMQNAGGAQRLRTLDLNLLVCRAASPCRRTIHDSCSAGCCSDPVGSDKCAHVRPDKMPGIAAGLSSNETAQ